VNTVSGMISFFWDRLVMVRLCRVFYSLNRVSIINGQDHAIFGTSPGHRFHFILPASFIEIGGQQLAGIVVEQWIQAHNLLSR